MGSRGYNLLALDGDFSGIRLHKAADALKEDGLTGAVAPDNAVDFSRFKADRHIVQGSRFFKTFGNSLYFYDITHFFSPFCISRSLLQNAPAEKLDNKTMAKISAGMV